MADFIPLGMDESDEESRSLSIISEDTEEEVEVMEDEAIPEHAVGESLSLAIASKLVKRTKPKSAIEPLSNLFHQLVPDRVVNIDKETQKEAALASTFVPVREQPEPLTTTTKAGKDWFNVKSFEMNEKNKREIKALQLRGQLDPKRFYKRSGKNKIPTVFQFGTVVAGAHEFYSSTLSKRDRAKSFMDDTLRDEKSLLHIHKAFSTFQASKPKKSKFRKTKRRKVHS